MADPLAWAMMAQGAGNALGNLANAQRGQRNTPVNNMPLMMMMMQKRQRDEAIERIKSDPNLTPAQRNALLVDPDAGAAAYVKAQFASSSPKVYSVSPGGAVVDASGREIYKNPLENKGMKPFALSPGQRLFDASGNMIAAVPPKPDTPPQPAMTERLMARYLALEQKKASGQPLTATEEANRRLLGFQLSSLRAGQGGAIESVGPPQLFPQASSATPTGVGQSDVSSASPATVTTIKEGEDKKAVDFSNERRILGNVIETLKEARSTGEIITGWRGALKAATGSVARDFGVPVSPLAEQLDARLETLAASLGPDLLNEKKITDQERKRLTKIVGDVSATTDELSLLNKLQDMDQFLTFIENKYGGKSVEQPVTPSPNPQAVIPGEDEIKAIAERHGKTPEEVRRDLEKHMIGGGM